MISNLDLIMMEANNEFEKTWGREKPWLPNFQSGTMSFEFWNEEDHQDKIDALNESNSIKAIEARDEYFREKYDFMDTYIRENYPEYYKEFSRKDFE